MINHQKNVIIADLDGTIALIEHRRHFVEGKSKQWRRFFKACPDDSPNQPVIDLLKTMDAAGYTIKIFSGRSDAVRNETVAWLKAHEVPYASLLMRKDGDFTPDEELKCHWLHSKPNLKNQIHFVLDDRQKVVDMWRNQGLTCLQVAPGDF